MVLTNALILFFLICLLIALWIKQQLKYWPKRNVPEPKNRVYYRQGKHFGYFTEDIYRSMKNSESPVTGAFLLIRPVMIVVDLDFAKNVFIGEFEAFPDRGFYHNLRDDPLSGNITRLKGEDWRRLRTKLSPTFTSGKMKQMLPLVVNVGERLADVLRTTLPEKTKGARELEVRDLCARYTTDVIGSIAFGIDCNSLLDPHTDFRVRGDMAIKSFEPIKETLAAEFPKFFQSLRVKSFPKTLIEFYSNIVTKNIANREANDNVKRGDFFDILMDLKNKDVDDETRLTIEEVVGQAFVFFIAGFETSSSTMTYCLFELSQNQEVQEKARRCILENLERHKGEFTYECLKDMQYLSQVVMETLRKYPIVPNIRRICRKPYKIPNTNILIEVGTHVIVPVYAIQNDPDLYSEPHRFDPDRFAPEEFKKRHPMAYLPFGAGPRVCIAERFAKMQTLLGLAKLLQHFRFTPSSNTPEKLIFDPRETRIFSHTNLHLNVEKI